MFPGQNTRFHRGNQVKTLSCFPVEWEIKGKNFVLVTRLEVFPGLIWDQRGKPSVFICWSIDRTFGSAKHVSRSTESVSGSYESSARKKLFVCFPSIDRVYCLTECVSRSIGSDSGLNIKYKTRRKNRLLVSRLAERVSQESEKRKGKTEIVFWSKIHAPHAGLEPAPSWYFMSVTPAKYY